MIGLLVAILIVLAVIMFQLHLALKLLGHIAYHACSDTDDQDDPIKQFLNKEKMRDKEN